MHPNQLFIEKSEKILRTRPKGCYLLYLDITDFQYINFCYGTEAGDRLLQAVNDYTAGLPFVLLCERLYSDYFLCILSFPERRRMKSRTGCGAQPQWFYGRTAEAVSGL